MFKISEQVNVWHMGTFYRGTIIHRSGTVYHLMLVGWGRLDNVKQEYIVRN